MTFYSINDPNQVRVHDDAVLDNQYVTGARVGIRDGALAAEFCAKLRDFPGIAEDGTDMMKAFEIANNVTIA
jgi:hypothetical protein